MPESVSDLVRRCIANRVKPASGARGTATVLLIEEQQDIFIELFTNMKKEGYTSSDLTSSHKKLLLNACCPKSTTGPEKTHWDAQTLKTMTCAEVVVFESRYSPDAAPIDDKELEFYLSRAEALQAYIDKKILSGIQKGDKTKEDTTPKEEEVPMFDTPKEFGLEPFPENIDEDYSWIPKGASK